MLQIIIWAADISPLPKCVFFFFFYIYKTHISTISVFKYTVGEKLSIILLKNLIQLKQQFSQPSSVSLP